MNKMMFQLVLAGCLVFGSCAIAGAQQTPPNTNAPIRITAEGARANIGKEVVVSGTVAEVNKGANVIRLNLDKAYPNQPFTAVIFSRNTNAFGDLQGLKGQKVEISGKITEYRKRPEIILTNTNQLKVIESSEGKKQ